MKRTKKSCSDRIRNCSGIACHFANIGVEVLLLDIVPRELTEAEAKKGLTLESTVVRNRLVNEHLNTALKSKPAPIYTQQFANRITTGNTTDDMAKLPMSIGLSKLL
jgi:3-hydroxyacyl-CoA dehydrogenase